jgi:hypothetical protein
MTFKQIEDTADLIAEHDLHIEALTTPMHIRMYRRHSDGALLVEQSHFLKTDIQYLPLAINKPFFCTEQEVIDQLMATMLNFCRQAKARGFEPSEKWIVPNTAFREMVDSTL